MKIRYDGHELLAKNLDTARLRDIAELQRQTGWKLDELRQNVEKIDILAAGVLVFLTLHNAGFTTVSWDNVLDQGFAEFEIVVEPGDQARAEDGGDVLDPPQHPEASEAVGDPPASTE